MSDTGREWTTSASSAPSVSTSVASCSAAMAVIWRQNVRHFSCGSVPSRSSTSVPGVDAAHSSLGGHTISRVTPSASRTTGRVVPKS